MILSSSTEFPKSLSPASYMHALIAMWSSTCALAVVERKLYFRLIPIAGKLSMMVNPCRCILRLATSSIHVNPIIGFGRTKLFGQIRPILFPKNSTKRQKQRSFPSSPASKTYSAPTEILNSREFGVSSRQTLFLFLRYRKTDPLTRICHKQDTNCLQVTPTHDAYLENGTLTGLTVGIYILSYASDPVNIP